MALGLALVGVSIMLGHRRDLLREKLSRFECGFEPMEKDQMSFCLRFFLLALVFLRFDLELVLFFPFVLISRRVVILVVFCLLLAFFAVLILGLFHEINEGVVDW